MDFLSCCLLLREERSLLELSPSCDFLLIQSLGLWICLSFLLAFVLDRAMSDPVDLFLLPDFVKLVNEGIKILGPELVDGLGAKSVIFVLFVLLLAQKLIDTLLCQRPHGH